MEDEENPIPDWIVVGARTGGTSATIGRYIRYRQLSTRLCVVDAENSVFYDYFNSRDIALTIDTGSQIEGIGRPRVEPSFIPDLVDRVIQVPDAASIAAMRFLEKRLGRKNGGTTAASPGFQPHHDQSLSDSACVRPVKGNQQSDITHQFLQEP